MPIIILFLIVSIKKQLSIKLLFFWVDKYKQVYINRLVAPAALLPEHLCLFL